MNKEILKQITSLGKKIDTLEKELGKLNDEREKLLDKYALTICPYKIGEIAVCKGYCFKGKEIKISRIDGFFGWDDKPSWQVVGNVLKQDGSLGKQIAKWDKSDEKD